jgi:hypothetical protein
VPLVFVLPDDAVGFRELIGAVAEYFDFGDHVTQFRIE